MIPDLRYPEEARKSMTALCEGLAYDAAIAVAGVALSKMPPPQGGPDLGVTIRCGGLEHDLAVRRDAPNLFSRFSLVSMISRFEFHAQHLLLERRVLEYLKRAGIKMDGPSFWKILIRVQSENRSGPVKMCDGLVVVRPSAALKAKMEWLGGLYRVRNCLAHRLGLVQMVDVKESGVPLDKARDPDRLKAVWLRPFFSMDGKEVQLPYTNASIDLAQAKFDFQPYTREWKIGEHIDVSPTDCQAVALSLTLLARQLQVDFEGEMNVVLGI